MIYGYLGGLWGLFRSRTSRLRFFYRVQTQSFRQVRFQSLEVAFGFLKLGQSQGAASFGQEVDREIVGWCTPHKVWEIGELEGGALLLHLCYFIIGGRVCLFSGGGVRRGGGRELADKFCKKSPGLLDGG
jgi:hypothetical protein